MGNTSFDLKESLDRIRHYLPSQATLKDFIHHNSLHAFQHSKFYDGIFDASKIFGYKVTLRLDDFRDLFLAGRITEKAIERCIINQLGSIDIKVWTKKLLFEKYDETFEPRIGKFRAIWKRQYHVDIDSLVHPTLYRLLCAYLDQGVSIWKFPVDSMGLLDAIRHVENTSHSSFFRTKAIKNLLNDSTITVEYLLKRLVGDENYYEQYLFDLCFASRGWYGLTSMIEQQPNILLITKAIRLEELVHLQLLMELDYVESKLSNVWKPLSECTGLKPMDILHSEGLTELDTVLSIWQDAFEWSYYDNVFAGIQSHYTRVKNPNEKDETSFQTIFCIDERECSLRRHIEFVAPQGQTFGAPGFFGVEFFYKQQGAQFIDKLCPAPVTPKYLIKESDAASHLEVDLMFSCSSHTLFKGFFSNFFLGFLSLWKMFQIIFRPKMSPSISDAYSHVSRGSVLSVENRSLEDRVDDLQIGFTIDEMVTRVENLLRNIGLIDHFAPLIYMMAHGSSSANNPHHGAHDCGACSGRPGIVNARVFSIMANHSAVREKLKSKGIMIPSETLFLPAMHDTAADIIQYYDEPKLDGDHHALHIEIKSYYERALDLNAKERSRRFASIDTNQPLDQIRKSIYDRSVSLFEPRPELGHGTNSLAIIGRREVTRGLFLDRRAFLNSYDYRTDLNGEILKNVMAPIGVVCGGINLEYYFSRVDNIKLGCGTKLPHNVMGCLGVANSSDGDLRPGLPWQMVEPHDPVRLLVIVEHYPEIVLHAIQSNEAMYEWYKNEWVHIAALNPDTKEFYYLKDEKFHLYHAEPKELDAVKNVHHLFEKAPEMMTNRISHATFENLPIYQIENTVQCI